jgi:CheY-like chemotaxis protein
MKTDTKKLRIVMVDDDDDLQEIVRGWLTPGYEHVPLSNGNNLAELLAGLAPDLLILDVRMPGRDGFNLCGALRRDGRFDSLPILFLTGAKEDMDFAANLNAGGSAFLTKPVARGALLRAIEDLVGGGKS